MSLEMVTTGALRNRFHGKVSTCLYLGTVMLEINA